MVGNHVRNLWGTSTGNIVHWSSRSGSWEDACQKSSDGEDSGWGEKQKHFGRILQMDFTWNFPQSEEPRRTSMWRFFRKRQGWLGFDIVPSRRLSQFLVDIRILLTVSTFVTPHGQLRNPKNSAKEIPSSFLPLSRTISSTCVPDWTRIYSLARGQINCVCTSIVMSCEWSDGQSDLWNSFWDLIDGWIYCSCSAISSIDDPMTDWLND